MHVVLSAPRGFCAGVVRAIEVVELCLERFGKPVYVRHEIVHNQYVVESLRRKGAVFVEELEHLAEIFEAAAEPVILVDHDGLHLALADEREQPLECRPVHIAAGETFVIEPFGVDFPSFTDSAFDEGFTRFSLSIKRAERLRSRGPPIRSSLGNKMLAHGLASVDCAPLDGSLRF